MFSCSYISLFFLVIFLLPLLSLLSVISVFKNLACPPPPPLNINCDPEHSDSPQWLHCCLLENVGRHWSRIKRIIIFKIHKLLSHPERSHGGRICFCSRRKQIKEKIKKTNDRYKRKKENNQKTQFELKLAATVQDYLQVDCCELE